MDGRTGPSAGLILRGYSRSRHRRHQATLLTHPVLSTYPHLFRFYHLADRQRASGAGSYKIKTFKQSMPPASNWSFTAGRTAKCPSWVKPKRTGTFAFSGDRRTTRGISPSLGVRSSDAQQGTAAPRHATTRHCPREIGTVSPFNR